MFLNAQPHPLPGRRSGAVYRRCRLHSDLTTQSAQYALPISQLIPALFYSVLGLFGQFIPKRSQVPCPPEPP